MFYDTFSLNLYLALNSLQKTVTILLFRNVNQRSSLFFFLSKIEISGLENVNHKNNKTRFPVSDTSSKFSTTNKSDYLIHFYLLSDWPDWKCRQRFIPVILVIWNHKEDNARCFSLPACNCDVIFCLQRPFIRWFNYKEKREEVSGVVVLHVRCAVSTTHCI